jgi:glucan phosphoethanolaminetransferase (alkaline phosphatase superfamily)
MSKDLATGGNVWDPYHKQISTPFSFRQNKLYFTGLIFCILGIIVSLVFMGITFGAAKQDVIASIAKTDDTFSYNSINPSFWIFSGLIFLFCIVIHVFKSYIFKTSIRETFSVSFLSIVILQLLLTGIFNNMSNIQDNVFDWVEEVKGSAPVSMEKSVQGYGLITLENDKMVIIDTEESFSKTKITFVETAP